MKDKKPKIKIAKAGIYICIPNNLIDENKEERINSLIEEYKNFADANKLIVTNIYVDRDNSKMQRYKFDADYAAKKFSLRFMYVEH